MKVIHKVFLEQAETQEIFLPKGAKILTIQTQSPESIHSQITMWYMFDKENVQLEQRTTIVIAGTGWEFDDSNLIYLSTIQQHGFVWHIFEKTP